MRFRLNRIRPAAFPAALAFMVLAGCTPAGNPSGVPGDSSDTNPFAMIGEGDTVFAAGNEPFWHVEVKGGEARYTTPDTPEPATWTVKRFAGRGGLTFSGSQNGAPFDLLVTQGTCNDGMSDRSYPFVATLSIGGVQHTGCAWSSGMGFTGPENP